MSEVSDNVAMKDVFVSHAWGDKPIVEPLVAALTGAGVTCWYDQLELQPGDSLIDGINEGLTHCRIVLFCLSENFLRGNWTQKEVNAAFTLSTLTDHDVTRLIPLMIADPELIQQHYPVQFGGMVYISWKGGQLDYVVDQVKRVISEVNAVGKDYWYGDAHKAYAEGDYLKAALTARKAVDSDPQFFAASVLYVASALKRQRPMDAYRFIFAKREEWLTGLEEPGVDLDILDYMQDTLTQSVVGNEIDETGFSFAILDFLATEANGNRAWRYFVRLFDKEGFKFHRDKIVLYAALQGKEHAIDWIRMKAMASEEETVRETVANILYIMAAKLPAHRPRVTEMAERLAEDEHEDVREAALPTCYRFASDGEAIACRALNDRAPMVRLMGFMLLAGVQNIDVDDDWTPEEGEPVAPASCFGPEIVEKMLNDPDEMVFDAVVEMIGEEKVACPAGVDIAEIDRPASEEARQLLVKTLARRDTEESHERLMEMALNDPGEFVRSEAIEALEESSRPLPSDYLRNLWEGETVSYVKENLESLVLEKGGDDIADIYLGILKRNLDSLYSSEKAFERLVKCGDTETTKLGIDLCVQAGKADIAASGLQGIVQAELIEEARSVVQWCLENEKEESLALLAAGRLTSVPLRTIERFQQHENPILRADALRAREKRLSDGSGLRGLQELYGTLKSEVLKKDNNSMWAALEVIDGILEFGSKDEAIRLLRDYYEVVDRLIKGGSFPLRAAWERLRILGVSIPHPVYDPSDHSVPYPWPSEDGPFYGIRSEDG